MIGDYVDVRGKMRLHPNGAVYRDVTIGAEVVLHAGCVIGADGFGYVLNDGIYEKFPQIGRVEIGDFVEIGANSCVDRAALGVTSIGAVEPNSTTWCTWATTATSDTMWSSQPRPAFVGRRGGGRLRRDRRTGRRRRQGAH